MDGFLPSSNWSAIFSRIFLRIVVSWFLVSGCPRSLSAISLSRDTASSCASRSSMTSGGWPARKSAQINSRARACQLFVWRFESLALLRRTASIARLTPAICSFVNRALSVTYPCSRSVCSRSPASSLFSFAPSSSSSFACGDIRVCSTAYDSSSTATRATTAQPLTLVLTPQLLHSKTTADLVTLCGANL